MDSGNMRTVIFFLFLSSGLCEVKSFYEPIRRIVDVESEPMASCLSAIVSLYFRCQSTVAMALPMTKKMSVNEVVFGDSVIRKLHRESRWSVVTLCSGNCSELYPHSDVIRIKYVVISGTTDEVIDFLENCDIWKLPGEETRLVVVLQELANVTGRTNDIQQVLNTAWKHDQLNVVILVKTTPDLVDIYSWLPLSLGAKAMILDSFTDGEFRFNTDLFPNKVLSDLMGYQITIGTMSNPPYMCHKDKEVYGGIEAMIVKTLAEVLNFRPQYRSFSVFGYIGWEKAMIDVSEGHTDVAVGGYSLSSKRFGNFSYTTIFVIDTIEWFVTGDLVMGSEFNEGAAAVLLLYISTCVICMVLMTLFVYTKRNLETKGTGSAWLLVWGTLFETPYIIQRLRTRQKFLWVLFAFCVLVTNTLLKSNLTSVLSIPKLIPKIRTVHDLVLSDIPIIYAGPPSRTFEFPDENINATHVKARVLDCPYLKCVTAKVLREPLGVTALRNGMTLLQNIVLPEPIFHSLDIPVGTHLVTMYTRKNYFLLPAIRRYMMRLTESGLIDHWRSRFMRKPDCDLTLTDIGRFITDPSIIADYRAKRRERRVGDLALQLVALESPFLFLARGYALSFLFFVCEVIKARRNVLISRLKTFIKSREKHVILI